jgi:phthalate 4,5-cis-dihydrodiol dehydrogenase
MGQQKEPGRYGGARRALRSVANSDVEAALKSARNYGGTNYKPPAPASRLQHQHFGFVVASCEKADLRPLPSGVMIYTDETQRLDPLPPPQIPRSEVIDELYEAATTGKPPLHSGEWARATLEVCLAILCSAQEGRTTILKHQIAAAAE